MRQTRGSNIQEKIDDVEMQKMQRYENILNMIENADLMSFGRIMQDLKKKDEPQEKIQRLEESFKEYFLVRRELFLELGGGYSVKALREKIPGNVFLEIFSGKFVTNGDCH